LADPPPPPSGEQFEIAFGDQQAVVVEVGGGLRTYSAGGHELVDGYPTGAMSSSGRGQVLIPWPNRIQDGTYEFGGGSHQLPINEQAAGNAIHGLMRWTAWDLKEREAARAVVEQVVHPQPGYPFTLAVAIEYALSEGGLSVSTTATNIGSDVCPFGAGNHPYVTAGTTLVDEALLRVPAGTMLESDERGIPTGAGPVNGTQYDFRGGRELGGTRLDNCFTDLDRDGDGLARVELLRPGGGGVALWMDAAYPYVMLFTGDPLQDVARRALAIEPMSCPPNAFRSGEALVRLEPGESWSGRWGIALVVAG
jgi:aldose 1-epimerase